MAYFDESYEEGEIVDDDFEDISDNSIIEPIHFGKLVSSKERLRALSLSSISDENNSDEPTTLKSRRKRRRRRLSTRNRRSDYTHRRRSDDFITISSSSESDNEYEANKELHQKLKEAIQISNEENERTTHNTLKERLQGMNGNVSTDYKEMSDGHELNQEDNEVEDDADLENLRLEALKTAILNKSELRKKRKALELQNNNNQINEDDVLDNKENEAIVQQKDTNDDEIITKKTCIEPNAIVDNSNNVQNDNLSLDEDEDVLRAALLAAMGKKPTKQTISDQNSDDNVNQEIINNNLIIRPSIAVGNRTINNLTRMTRVKPLIINVNNDSDSDEEEEEVGKKIVQKSIDLSNTVDQFLKQQRAQFEQSNRNKLISTNNNSNSKSAVNLLPKSQQIEYETLMKRLKNAENVRKIRNRIANNNNNIKKDGIGTSGIPRKTQFVILQRTMRDIQISKNGSLQIKNKYQILSPIMEQIKNVRNNMKENENFIKKLLNELNGARSKLTKQEQDYNNLVKNLVVKKKLIDRSHLKKIKSINTTTIGSSTVSTINSTSNIITKNTSTIVLNNSNNKTQPLVADIKPKLVIISEKEEVNNVDEVKCILPEYISPLDHTERKDPVDPLGIMCPFEVNGSCRDTNCSFTHYLKDSCNNG